MPRCGCQDACSCLIVAGDGISVEGIGTLERPYEITSESADLTGRIEFTDEGNVDFTVTGVGTLNDPTTVFADAHLAVTDLIDVSDTDAPVEGDVLVWRIDHWEFEQQSGSGGGAGLPPGGTDGQVLTKISNADGDADWEDPTGASGSAVVKPTEYVILRANAAQSMPQASETAITYAAATSDDPFGMWDGASLVTVKSAGLYDVTYSYGYAATAAAGNRITLIRINGTTFRQWYHSFNSGINVMGTVTFEVKLNAGDTIQARQYQSSGSAMDTTGTPVAYAPSLFVSKQDVVIEPGGGGVIVERPVAMSRRQTAAVPVAQGAIVTMPWDTEDFNEGFAPVVGGVIIIPSDGYYQVNTKVNWESNTTGYRQVRIGVSGSSNTAGIFTCTPNSGTAGVTEGYGRLLRCVAGDTVTVTVNHNVAATLNAGNAANYNSFDIVKVPTAYAGSAVSTYGEQNYATSRGHAALTSIPNAAATNVPFDTPFFEDGITWNGSGFVVPVAGYYDVEALVSYTNSNMTGVRSALLYLNGTQQQSVAGGPITSQPSTTVVAATLKCAAGDVIYVKAYQTSGAALTTSGNQNYTRVTIAKVPAPVINGAAASGVWGAAPLETSLYGTNDLIGREIYIDSRGQLRSKPAGGEMGGGVNLDTMDRTGQWSQTQNADAASGLNYPAPLAGMLEVITNDAYNGSMTWQRYTTYASGVDGGGAVYTRGRYNGVWAPWVCTSGPGQPFAWASGVSTLGASVAAGVGVSLAISYPVGRFSVAPIVVASADSNGYGVASAAGSTQTGCTLRYYNPTASTHSTCKVHWIATQMTPTSATG